MYKSILLPCLMFSISFISAQQHFLLSKFSGFKDDDRIVLNWTIKQGSSCFGIGILRSTDNINYEVIGEISGVCGSHDFPQSYTFIDENPVHNSKNYYVLELGFSGRTESPLIIDFIKLEDNGYKIIPNPVTNASKLLFDNKHNDLYTLKIYSSIGQLLSTNVSTDDFFEINITETTSSKLKPVTISNNIYFFRIEDAFGNVKTKGKFLIVYP